jgi:hypothetical protein
MAFLSAGHVPGEGPYGDVLNKGLDYILAHANANGMITDRTSQGPMYSHGISTLLLCEVTGMVDADRQKKIDAALPAALALILAAQQVNKNPQHAGGWRYQPTSKDSDISCAGWQLMALRAARNCGAPVPVEAINNAVAFNERCATKDGGFAYQPGQGSGFARTGTGLLCLELCGQHQSPLAHAAGDWLLKHPDKQYGGNFYCYGVYYATQGMFQLGGKYWLDYAQQAYPLLLKYQKPDGSWPQGSSNESQAGPCYSTATCVLALTVGYRQLPIYQR